MSAKEDPVDDMDPVAGAVMDGNAVAGTLYAAFGTDLTAVPSRCAHCHAVSAVAELRAYVRAPGTILRCPTCAGVVLRIVETEDAVYVDARGAAFLRLERR
jgi:phage FluMu protein Com